jgi:hypothetical protein
MRTQDIPGIRKGEISMSVISDYHADVHGQNKKYVGETDDARRYNVMLAQFPGQGYHPDSSTYITNLMPALLHDRHIDNILNWYRLDTPITMVRNRCIREAQLAGMDYVLMIDADMTPDYNPFAKDAPPKFWDVAWEFMMERRAAENKAMDGRVGDKDSLREFRLTHFSPATIGAPYCGPSPIENCYVFRWMGRETGGASPNFAIKNFDRDEAARMHGITEVAALPTGLILYDIRVFDSLPKPWFEYEWTDERHDEKKSTEDVYQTRNASLMGMPQLCAWDCWAGHNKNKLVHKPVPFTVQTARREFAQAVLRGAGFKVTEASAMKHEEPSPVS